MNIIKLQDMLRSVPDNALIGYVQNPQGQVPSYLALSELQRRKDTRAKYEQQQAPESSVAEDLEQETSQADQGGLAMLAGQPQQDMADQGVAGLDTGDMYQEDSFAAGGIVAFEEGGYTSRDRLANAPKILRGDVVKENDPWYSRMARNYNRLFDLSGTVRDPLIKQMQRENVAKTPFNPFLLGEYDVKTYDEYTGLKEKARQMKADQKDYDRMKELEDQFKTSQEKIPTGGGATKESIAAMQKQEAAQAAEDAKKNPYKPLSDKEKESIKKQFGYDEGKSTSKGNAPAQQAADSYEDGLRKRMGIYKEFMGSNEDRDKLNKKIEAMEARAARQEEMAPWMALTEAGFKTMAGTSPFALTNLGAGAEAGLKSYGAAQDKMASLEEKRYALMNDAAKADRAERQAAIQFGENSYQHQAALEQKERLGLAELDLRREANRLTKDFNTARLNASSEKGLLKSQAEQMIKVNKGIDEQLSYLAAAPKSEKITAMINNLKAQKAQNEAHVKSIYANLKNSGLANTTFKSSDFTVEELPGQ